MKSQPIHSTPMTLGPFLRPLLTVVACHNAETADLAFPSPELSMLRPDITRSRPETPYAEHHVVSTRAMTLGPFLTLLLTLHHRGMRIDGD
jgi:hypothetical protein